jgi:hypothetical protein
MAENSAADEPSRLRWNGDSDAPTEAGSQEDRAHLTPHPAVWPPAPYWRPGWTLDGTHAASARKRQIVARRALGLLVGCAILLAVIYVGAFHHGSTAAVPSPPSATRAIGQIAKDGDFAFVVKSVSCGPAANAVVSNNGETVPATAQECLVTMTITDDTGTSQTYFAGNQYAYDPAGRRFSADATAAESLIAVDDDTHLDPGATITAILPFQIPARDRIVRLELHDSAFSGGVTVDV